MDEDYPDIDSLIAKFLAGEALPEEAMALEDWCNTTDENSRLFAEAESTWVLGKKKKYSSLAQKEKVWNIILEKREKRFFTPIRFAASLILLAGATVVFMLTILNPATEEEQWITQVSLTEPYRWILSDSTAITLNDSSQLRYPKKFTHNVRRIELTGEAYFIVSPDANKPFVVVTDEVEVTVLGTAFNVSASSQDSLVQVQVTQGKVKMKHAADSLLLSADEKGLYHKNTHRLWREQHVNHNNIGYATHSFVYEDRALDEILSELSVAYGVTITLEDTRVRQCRLTGNYHDMALETVLEVISQSLDLTYTYRGKQVHISGNGCL